MTNEMAAAIVGGLISAVAVVAGSWIAAWFTYKYARSKDREDHTERRRVLASSMLVEVLRAEVRVDLMIRSGVKLKFKAPPLRTPLLDRLPDVADLFSPGSLSALSYFQAMFAVFTETVEESRRRALEMEMNAATRDAIQDYLVQQTHVLTLLSRKVYGAEADAVDSLIRSGGVLPQDHASTPIERETPPIAELIGWSKEEGERLGSALEDRATRPLAEQLQMQPMGSVSEFRMVHRDDSTV